MYKLLIVDDEKTIREGIKNSIDWPRYGISEVDVASCYEEAVLILPVMRPHIILCDIMMGEKSGFDVMEKVKAICPESKLIFLTGHDTFQFAQRAIRLGAFDYLLKISNVDEIIEVTNKAIEAIKKESDHQKSYETLRSEMENFHPLIKNRYMNMLIQGKEGENNPDSSENPYVAWIKSREANHVMLVAIRIADRPPGDEGNITSGLLRKRISSWFDEMSSDDLMLFQNQGGDFIIIRVFSDSSDGREPEKAFLDRCVSFKGDIKEDIGLSVVIGASQVHKSCNHIRLEYQQAIEALDYFNLNRDSIIHYEKIKNYSKIRPSITIATEKQFISAFKSYNHKELEEILAHIFGQFENSEIIEKREVIDLALVLYGMVRKELLELQITIPQGESFYNQILRAIDYLNLKARVFEWFLKCSQIVAESHVRVVMENIQSACEYIENHFDEDLSLDKMAGIFNLSPNHFSCLFSREIGMSFLHYLTNCRIEKAKILLMDKNYKTYEVGECVGYVNPHYFSRIFKKYSGMAPTTYRENMLKPGPPL